MKKTKRIIAIFGVALIMLAPLLGLIPPAVGKAYAAPNDDATVEKQLQSYIYARAVGHCIAESQLPDGAFKDRINEDNAANFQWFRKENKVALPGQEYNGKDVWIGYLDEDSEIKCGETKWLGQAFDLWGLNGPDWEAICYAGFRREEGSKDQDAEDCRQGRGDFRFDEDRDDAINQLLTNVQKHFYGQTSSKLPTMTDAVKFYYYYRSFTGLCEATQRDDPDSYDDSDLSDHIYKIIGLDGSAEVWEIDKGGDDTVPTYSNVGGNPHRVKCKDLAKGASDETLAAAYQAEEPDQASAGASGTTESGAIDTECGDFNFDVVSTLNWVICPFITGATSAANGLENIIAGMLCVNESDIFGTNMTCDGQAGSSQSREAFHNAWNVFRVLALGVLAIGGLLMIFSQALGFEVFDAYTIKRVLPRILVAAILISLSWQLLEFVVSFSNALGIGVRAVIYRPFLDSGIDDVVLKGGSGALTTIFGFIGWKILGPWAVLSFLGTGLLALLIAFFILVIRNILVIMLILIAPIAIAMYVMPNTEKYAKLWWDWLFKALLAFPIITAIIAVGHVFAAITSQKNSGDSTLNTVVAFVAYFAPYFLIPAAFRFAGGALGTIGGFVNDRSRGGFDMLRNFRKNQSTARMGHYREKYGDQLMRGREQMIERLGQRKDETDARGNLKRNWGSRAAIGWTSRQVQGLGDFQSKMSEVQARANKRQQDAVATGKDSWRRGSTVDMSMGWEKALADSQAAKARADAARASGDEEAAKREEAGIIARVDEVRDGAGELVGHKRVWKTLGGGWVDDNSAKEGHRLFDRDRGAQQANLSYEMRKALTDEDHERIRTKYRDVATKQWGMTEEQLGGAWIGAAFENQNLNLSYKHTRQSGPDAGTIDFRKYLQEMYEKKGNYSISQMSADAVEQLIKAYGQAETAGDADAVAWGKSVANTFMHQLGSTPRGEDGEPQMDPAAVQAALDAAGVRGPAADNARAAARSVNSSGSGAVAEAVYKFAERARVLDQEPDNPRRPGSQHTGPPNNPSGP